MRSRALYTIMTLVMLAFLSCSKDDEPGTAIPADAVYDIVTLTASDANGSTFEMQKSDDSPLITYTSKYNLAASSKQIDVGDRIIICYKPQNGMVYTSGPINLYGFILLANTSKGITDGTASEYDNWDIPAVDMVSLWRSGHYINIEVKILLHEAQKPEKCELVLDTSTVDDDYPQLYFVYANKKGNDGENRYGINTSFDINALWSKETCKGVTVNYNTPKGMESVKKEKGLLKVKDKR